MPESARSRLFSFLHGNIGISHVRHRPEEERLLSGHPPRGGGGASLHQDVMPISYFRRDRPFDGPVLKGLLGLHVKITRLSGRQKSGLGPAPTSPNTVHFHRKMDTC